ncbi:dihydrolipoamide acetyltransferase family protein [Arthrobacter crystallopoietes]|uniref:Dihydrolipoamide acetyltransferase component of pyruvate dehydrogenase complex n=1 Tax=Crystallibacter crystallopoietes TaxID=37928 RepID=A0A1H1H522_9MICC|nr:dihydrolipoamide acetyltransferase family protein [Arthrobacter crystallopoietes]AUI52149.1 branched-chain alpha-keto acid dehydrogenase subunit E2 [Arthrobacter crystallopoietes]SDR20514.1 pyruvate dehydrogenase E2 component (dihydrolipoamide acetyltransferase) [Arthrobacter crystallopoietes]
MGIKVFKLPDLGEGLTESEIVSWHVAEGDRVELNQILGEVETAKAVVELPSPFAGVVTALHEAPGSTVNVGEPIVSFEVAGSDPSENGTGGQSSNGTATATASGREANLVGYGAQAEAAGAPRRRRRAGAVEAARAVPAATTPPAPGSVVSAPASPVGERAEFVKERPRSTPPVRKLARDLGIDLAGVTGTGEQGLITRADVESFHTGAAAGAGERGQEQPAAAAAAAARAGRWLAGAAERESRIPIKGVRKHTAAAMVASAFTAPHATSFLTVDVTPTMELLAKLRESRAFRDIKVTPLTVLAKAVCIALEHSPSLNWRWDEDNQEIVRQNYVNLGIAAATERGLIVPNIKDAHTLDLRQLAQALGELTGAARSGKTAPADLSGGTISITNIGVFGIDAGTPIINPGEAAILAMGAVRRQPWEYQGGIALRQVVTLSLSFDHRLVDGQQGATFLADVGTILAEPGMVLTMV